MFKLSNISISLDVPVGERPEPVAVYLYHPRLRASKDPDPNPILSHEQGSSVRFSRQSANFTPKKSPPPWRNFAPTLP